MPVSKRAQRIPTRLNRLLLIGLVFGLLTACTSEPPAHNEVLVFAAASTTDALSAVAQAYEAQSDNKITFSFASSATIARQIAQGAPAEIYISANLRWMDYLADQHKIHANSRISLLANRLALVAPKTSKLEEVNIHPGFPLEKWLHGGYLAMGNPAHVPAGIYGKQALQSMQVWSAVQDQIARSADVRAALALVARGETPLGIVYRTDAFAADDVKIVGIFPKGSHKAIVYPAALTLNVTPNDAAARDFYRFLDSDKADGILASYGFKIIEH